jgi:integrase
MRLDNPASAVSTLDDRREPDAPARRPFDEAELRTLLSVAKGDWRGMVLGGLYAGQRIGDLASLTRRKVDLAEELIKFRSQKTGRDMVIPIAPPLLDYLKKHVPEEPDGPIFPKAHAERIEADGESRRLSKQFHELLVTAGHAEASSKDKKQRARSLRPAHGERAVVSQSPAQHHVVAQTCRRPNWSAANTPTWTTRPNGKLSSNSRS